MPSKQAILAALIATSAMTAVAAPVDGPSPSYAVADAHSYSSPAPVADAVDAATLAARTEVAAADATPSSTTTDDVSGTNGLSGHHVDLNKRCRREGCKTPVPDHMYSQACKMM